VIVIDPYVTLSKLAQGSLDTCPNPDYSKQVNPPPGTMTLSPASDLQTRQIVWARNTQRDTIVQPAWVWAGWYREEAKTTITTRG
jgi:hypothetical protein